MNSSRNRWLVAASVAMFAVALVVAAFAVFLRPSAQADASAHGQTWFTGKAWMPIARPYYAHGFTFRDQRGKPVSLKQFRGKIVLLSFTSAVCKQQCPLIGKAVTRTERLLGGSSSQTVLLNMSVDPEADNRVVVNKFAREMGWNVYRWYYVWGRRSAMKPIWKAYGIYVPAPPPIYKAGRNLVHTAATALIDQQGHVRGFFPYPFLPSNLATGVKDLLHT